MATKTAKPALVSLLTKIAEEHLFFDTLETRHSGVDFHEVSVWGVRDALEAAFRAGQQSK